MDWRAVLGVGTERNDSAVDIVVAALIGGGLA
jgi:hypothetical protein